MSLTFLGVGFQSLKIFVKYEPSYLKIIVRCIIIVLSSICDIFEPLWPKAVKIKAEKTRGILVVIDVFWVAVFNP